MTLMALVNAGKVRVEVDIRVDESHRRKETAMEWGIFNDETADWAGDEVERPVARDIGRREALGSGLKELAARWPLLFAALREVATYPARSCKENCQLPLPCGLYHV
jgi:hypothetical protein